MYPNLNISKDINQDSRGFQHIAE